MWFGIISLFPNMFDILHTSITGRALQSNLIQLEVFNPRDFATDKHQSVDAAPYGGGPGMVMMPDPLHAAIQAAKKQINRPTKVIYLSPQGKQFNQTVATEMAQEAGLIMLAGRYEGIDERIISEDIDEEWSIGDYILTGGELPIMVMIDAITRLLPGVLHDKQSVTEDSLATGLLKYPQYTRPENWQGKRVPNVLLSGHHQQITIWRRQNALANTWLKRPDLLEKKQLTEPELLLLLDFIKNFSGKKTLDK